MVLALLLALAASGPPLVGGVPPAGDPEVVKGIRLVEEGEGADDDAIVILDTAARRIAGAAQASVDLPRAYAYLAIAYVRKGNDLLARATFRAALRGGRHLRLDAARLPPKVIAVFKAARDEVGRDSSDTAGPGSTSVVVAGVGGVAIAGAVIAAGRDAAPPTTLGGTLESFSETLLAGASRDFPIVAESTGPFEATVTWTNPDAALAMELYAVNGSGALATSRTTSGTSAILTTSVSPQTYTLRLFHRGGCGSTGLCSTSFSLSVVRP